MIKRCLLLIACTVAACDNVLEPEIASLTIEAATTRLFPGDTTRLSAIAQDARGDYIITEDLGWQSLDTTVIRVTHDGLAVAVRPGSAVLRLQLAGATAERTLRVDSGFVFVEGGPEATCAFRHNGDLYCWGTGRAIGGQREVLPRRVPTSLRFKQFSVGSNHTCAVTFDRKAYCWGGGRKGESGTGDVFQNSSVPVAVAGDHQFAEISAGWEHTCALTPEGVAYCWGRNSEGQLGNPEIFSLKLIPTPVQTPLRFKQLQAAGTNTCGLTLDGDMYCWGHRDYLGDTRFTEDQHQPQRIAVPKLRYFDSANDDPCGITLSDELYCWTNAVHQISMVGRVKDVTVGGGHICVVKIDDKVGCWGDGSRGALGDNAGQDRETPVEPFGALKFNQISAGAMHTCGVTDAGATYCWGGNGFGQLGNGTTGAAYRPARVLLFE